MKTGRIIAILLLISMLMPVTALSRADVEPNGDMQNAELIDTGKMYYGHLSPSDVVDWYKVPINEEEGFRITVKGDVRASIYDNSGKYVTNNFDLYNTENPQLIFYSPHQSGFVYIKIIENAFTLDNRDYSLFIEVKRIPSAPRNLEITYVSDKKITLKWDPPEDDGGVGLKYTEEGTGISYKIYRDGKYIGRATIILPTQYVAPTTYTNTVEIQGDYPRPEQGYNYSWYVTAVSWVGESEPSNTVHAGLSDSEQVSSEDSPALSAPLIILGVLGAAAVVGIRRRKS